VQPLAERCLPYYSRLHEYRISRLSTPGGPDASGLR
jgi:hypothetical protein